MGEKENVRTQTFGDLSFGENLTVTFERYWEIRYWYSREKSNRDPR